MDVTNLEDLKNWKEKTDERTVVAVAFETLVFIMLDVLAISGNIMVIAAVIRNKSLRSITHQYIAILSVTDLIQALFGLPLSIVTSVTGEWPYGSVLCHVQGCSILTLSTFAMCVVSITAVNRYFCVVRPTLYKSIFNSKSTVVISLSAFLSCTGLILVGSLTLSAKFQYGPHIMCIPVFPTQTIQKAVLLPSFFVFILIPMFTVCVSYFKVFRQVRQHVNRVGPRLAIPGTTRRLRTGVEEARINKVVFVLILVFVILWIPVVIVGTLFVLKVFQPRWTHLMYDYFVFANTASNPIVYGLFNKAFRAEFGRMLACRKFREAAFLRVEFSGMTSRRRERTSLRITRVKPKTPNTEMALSQQVTCVDERASKKTKTTKQTI